MRKLPRPSCRDLFFFCCCPVKVREHFGRKQREKWEKEVMRMRDLEKKHALEAETLHFAGTGSRRPLTPFASLDMQQQTNESHRTFSDSSNLLQTQSILFAKLPPELRCIIWEYCIVGQTFYVVTRQWNDRDEPLSAPQVCHLVYEAGHEEENTLHSHRGKLEKAHQRLLALPLSCRRA